MKPYMYFSGTGGPGPGQYDPFKDPGIRAPIDLVSYEMSSQTYKFKVVVAFFLLHECV